MFVLLIHLGSVSQDVSVVVLHRYFTREREGLINMADTMVNAGVWVCAKIIYNSTTNCTVESFLKQLTFLPQNLPFTFKQVLPLYNCTYVRNCGRPHHQ